jgi:hypothetical protein
MTSGVNAHREHRFLFESSSQDTPPLLCKYTRAADAMKRQKLRGGALAAAVARRRARARAHRGDGLRESARGTRGRLAEKACHPRRHAPPL